MSALRRAVASRACVAGVILTALILVVAIAAPLLAPASPTAQQLTEALLPPGPGHWLGTDQLGRDVLSRLLFAARTDLGVAALAALTPFVLGVAIGLISGYFGGAVDWVASRVTDTVIAFPFYVIVIALVFALGADAGGIVVAFALVGWVGYARVIRSMTASLRESGWVRSARGAGLSHPRVLLRHVLPNVLPQAVVLLASEIVLIMVAIVTLGYLGLGIRPPTPDWGTMIADAQPFITTQWWLAAFPGLAVVLTGVALSLLGDGIGDVLRVERPGVRRVRRVRRGRRIATRPDGARVDRRSPNPSRRPAEAPGQAPPELEPGAVRVRGLAIGDPTGRPLVGGAAGLSFEVAPGGAVGLVGESGSGKSLTLRALLGILPRGVEIVGGAAATGGRVGMVFQDPLTALDPLARIGVQLGAAVSAAAPRASRAEVRARVSALIERVRLPDTVRIARAYPHQLSGGQRQRVVIALALAGDPDILLCDEPTTALDVTVQREVLQLLAELREERGLTLVFVSHDLAVVAELCERVVVLASGTLVESGPTARVIRAPRSAAARALVTAVPELPPLAHPGSGEPGVGAEPGDAAKPGVAPGLGPARAPAGGAAAAPPLLEARDVVVRYGGFTAVAGASFALAAGGSLGIVGESGSGKTSLARALTGQLPLVAGVVALAGTPLADRRGAETLRRIQLVPQDPYSSLTPRRTVGSALDEVLRARGFGGSGGAGRSARRERVRALLALVRLDPALASATPGTLSGGQRQRVAIARALAADPQVLVADEPTSALDVSVQASVIALLQRLRQDLGLAIVFVSHDLAVVHELCDDVLVMRGGAIVERGGPEFFRSPQTPYGRELLTAVPRL